MTAPDDAASEAPRAVVESHGVSPWELEVVHSYLSSRFSVRQEAVPDEDADPDVVSMLSLRFPFAFTEQFFEWFDYRRWEKVKALFREMKRRRGSKRALRIRVGFAGEPSIRFVADSADRQLFDTSIEKIDFVLELLPYHLGPDSLPRGTEAITYRFDEKARRWRIAPDGAAAAAAAAGGGGGEGTAAAEGEGKEGAAATTRVC